MANKVISIKLDEKDIERLKNYHEALKDLGIISDRTLTMNGLYKHLLLDYLEHDAYEMINTCTKFGLFPRYVAPDEIDCGYAIFSNPYNLKKELYDIYVKCIKDSQIKGINSIEHNIDKINEVTNNEDFFCKKGTGEIVVLPKGGTGVCDPVDANSFWYEKATEERERILKSGSNPVAWDLTMIGEATSVSQEEKEMLVEAIEKYEKDRKQHFAMVSGRRG